MIAAAVDRLSGRPDRAAPHRHLFRHDHGGDRGGVLLRRVQSAVGLDRRRERPARRADAELQSRLHHHPFHHRLVALSVPRAVLFHRRRDRAAHRALAGRRDLQRDPRQSAARHRGRPQHPRLQADRLRDRRRLCRLCRRPARRAAGLHAARRLHLRHLRPARDADRDRRPGHAVRSAGRRRRLAVPAGFPAGRARSGRGLEARARRRLRAAGLLPAPRHHRRPRRSLRPHVAASEPRQGCRSRRRRLRSTMPPQAAAGADAAPRAGRARPPIPGRSCRPPA